MVRKGSPKAVLRTPQRLYSRGGDLPLRAIAHETESREAGDHHRSGLSKRAGEMSRETKKSMNPRSPTIICPASKPSHFAQPDCPVRAMRGGVLKAFALARRQNAPRTGVITISRSLPEQPQGGRLAPNPSSKRWRSTAKVSVTRRRIFRRL
jgi:hypothetical protein